MLLLQPKSHTCSASFTTDEPQRASGPPLLSITMLSVSDFSAMFVCVQAAGVEQMRCNNKTRFILAVVAGKLKISNRKRADIEEQLVSDGFDKMPNRGATVNLP